MPTPSRPEFVIFYAWQSDRPGNGNRYLIQEAAVKAAETINADPASPYEVRIDQDTQGVPGLCDIPATILEKIDKADGFLCDLTYVATSAAENEDEEDFQPRYCSNPNVLFELGYAFRSMGFARLLCVMNERYGPVAEQIFDIAHRRYPFTYTYPAEDRTRTQVLTGLAAKIEEGIRALFPLGMRSESGAADRVQTIRTEFETRVRVTGFHGLVRRQGALAIAVIPAAGRQFDWQLLKRQQIPPPGSNGWNHGFRGKAILSVTPGEPGPFSIAELRTDGVILACNTSLIDPVYNRDPHYVVPAPAIESALFTSVEAYFRTLRTINAPLPWHVCISLLEVHGHRLLVSSHDTSKRYDAESHILCDPLIVKNFAEIDSDQKIADFLQPAIDFIWREFGLEGSWNHTGNGIYNSR